MASVWLVGYWSVKMQSFSERLSQAIRQRGNPVLVGLDPRLDQLPEGMFSGEPGDLKAQANAYAVFCKAVVDVVAPLAPAVKPQAAFFEEIGPHGMAALADVIAYARQKGLLVIFDGKRNDIGSTATAYAQGILGAKSPWGADAITVSPYLGEDSLAPFIDVAKKTDAGVFVLVKTSNPGGGMLQDLTCDGRTIYRRVADYVEGIAKETANGAGYGAVGAVVGATYPQQLAELRAAMPHAWFLVPGFGAQGGTAKDVAAAFDDDGLGGIVNNSRGIIFAYRAKRYAERFAPSQWQEAVEAATRDMIEQLRAETPAGRLATG